MLSLVAHAVGYKIIVGTHNTVNVRCMWEVVSSSSGMADVGACHTVDAQRHARGFTVLVWYGSCGHPQHCRENIDAHNTAWILTCLEGCRTLFLICPVGVQGTVLGIAV